MKRCIEAHAVASFGEIPVGSLWDDDSPHITDESKFATVDAPTDETPTKRPVKKSAAKPRES